MTLRVARVLSFGGVIICFTKPRFWWFLRCACYSNLYTQHFCPRENRSFLGVSVTNQFLGNGRAMRFTLLDRIVEVDPGKSITAVKAVSLSEEYLADHFPRFPVLPGVFMLEAMTQAAAWTIRLGEDFANSIVVLRTARNVKYGDFVEPGKVLTVHAEVLSQDAHRTKVKASGMVGERTSLTARLELERYNLADKRPYGDAMDVRVRSEMRRLWTVLNPGKRGSAALGRTVYGVNSEISSSPGVV